MSSVNVMNSNEHVEKDVHPLNRLLLEIAAAAAEIMNKMKDLSNDMYQVKVNN